MPGDDANPEVLDEGGKADAPAKPVGTFRLTSRYEGGTAVLALLTDKTFHREVITACRREPCAWTKFDGTYTFSTSGATRYLRLKDATGAVIRFAYDFDHDQGTLALRAVGTDEWQDLMRDRSYLWCAAVEDCERQEAYPLDPGIWECRHDTCDYVEPPNQI